MANLQVKLKLPSLIDVPIPLKQDGKLGAYVSLDTTGDLDFDGQFQLSRDITFKNTLLHVEGGGRFTRRRKAVRSSTTSR